MVMHDTGLARRRLRATVAFGDRLPSHIHMYIAISGRQQKACEKWLVLVDNSPSLNKCIIYQLKWWLLTLNTLIHIFPSTIPHKLTSMAFVQGQWRVSQWTRHELTHACSVLTSRTEPSESPCLKTRGPIMSHFGVAFWQPHFLKKRGYPSISRRIVYVCDWNSCRRSVIHDVVVRCEAMRIIYALWLFDIAHDGINHLESSKCIH